MCVAMECVSCDAYGCCFYCVVVIVMYCDLVLHHLTHCLYLCLCISGSMLMVFGGTDQTIER